MRRGRRERAPQVAARIDVTRVTEKDRNPWRIMESEMVARDGPLTQEGPAPCRAFIWWRTRGPVHQVTVTSFEQLVVPALQTLYVALLTVLGGLSV